MCLFFSFFLFRLKKRRRRRWRKEKRRTSRRKKNKIKISKIFKFFNRKPKKNLFQLSSFVHCIVSNFNIVKTLDTYRTQAGLFWCFHNFRHKPSNSDVWTTTVQLLQDLFLVNFNVRMWSFCLRIHGATSIYNLLRMTFVESAQNLTPEKYEGGRKA